MILSDDEIAKCWLSIPDPVALGGQFQENQDIRYFANAVITATVAKLAAGVSVEPACYVAPYEVNHIYWDAGHDDDAGCNSPLYTATAIAAARVQENERLACEFDKLYTYGGDEIGPAIRALIGAKTC